MAQELIGGISGIQPFKAPDEEDANGGAKPEPFVYWAECQKCGWTGVRGSVKAARADAAAHEAQRKHKRHPRIHRALA